MKVIKLCWVQVFGWMINSKYTTNDCLKVFNFCLGFPVVDSASHPFLASPDPSSFPTSPPSFPTSPPSFPTSPPLPPHFCICWHAKQLIKCWRKMTTGGYLEGYLGFRSAQPLTPDSYKYLISAYNITLNETSMSEKLSPSKGALAR